MFIHTHTKREREREREREEISYENENGQSQPLNKQKIKYLKDIIYHVMKYFKPS